MEIVRYMEQSIKKAMDDPEHMERMKKAGLTLKFMGVEEFSKFLESQNDRAKQLIATVPQMSRVDTIVWGVLLAFGAFVIHESLDHKYYGSDFGPGPGFFSFWLGILLMVLSLIQIVMTWRRPAEPLPAGFIPNREGIKRMLSIIGALVGSASF